MAEYVGSGPYYATQGSNGQGTQGGQQNKSIKNTDPGTQTGTSVTTVNPATWQQFRPAVAMGNTATQGGTGGSPSSPNNDAGFNFASADFDATVAAPGGLPANRVVVDGTLTCNIVLSYSGVNTANIVSVLVYKRASGGGLTLLLSLLSGSKSSATPSFTITGALPRTTFSPGEDFHIEVWAKSNDVVAGVTHQTVTLGHLDLDCLLRYEYVRSYAGGNTPSGGIIKVAKKWTNQALSPTNTVTTGGVIIKNQFKFFTGAISSGNLTGSLTKIAKKFYTGSAGTPSGNLIKRANKVFAGSVASSGASIKFLVNKALSGGATPTGSLTKLAKKFFTASVSSAPGVLRIVALKPFAGNITPTPGTLVRKPIKLLTANIAPAAANLKWFVFKKLSGGLAPTGTLTKLAKIFNTGSIASSGILRKIPNKYFVGTITPGPGTMGRAIVKSLAGSLGSSGTITRKVNKLLSGVVNPAATVKFTLAKYFKGYLYNASGDGTGGTNIIKKIIVNIFDD